MQDARSSTALKLVFLSRIFRVSPSFLLASAHLPLVSSQPTKVVIVTNGRYAGRKAVIVKNFDEGTPSRPYGHALVAGIATYPRKVTKRMPKKKLDKHSKIKVRNPREFFCGIQSAHLSVLLRPSSSLSTTTT